METNYWSRILTQRLSRRRSLAGLASVGLGLGGLSLVGCGDDAKDGPTAATNSGQILQPVDSSKDAKRGGILKFFRTIDENTFDGITTSRHPNGSPATNAYSRLVQEKWTPGKPQYVGDMAEGWEVSPDGLKVTFKLRQDAKFDARPPTNSRTPNAEDVIFSVDKYLASSPWASLLANRIDANAPLLGAQQIDSRTVQFNLAFPSSGIFSTMILAPVFIMPTESSSLFDPRKDMRGSGPWTLQTYEPSVRFQWRKNPNWYTKDFPYLDGFDEPIVTEPTQRVAQFRAKNLDVLTLNGGSAGGNTSSNYPGDVIDTKRSLPEVRMYQDDRLSSSVTIHFGSKPGSQFADVRVRRAVSMALDRNGLALTSGVDLYEKAGIPTPFDLSGFLTGFYADFWLDPRDGSKWGDGGVGWKFDPAAAKQLVQAAGYKDGFETKMLKGAHGTPNEAAIITSNLTDVGIRTTIQPVDQVTVFLPKLLVVPPGEPRGDFDGFTLGRGSGTSAANHLFAIWHTKGSLSAARRWDAEQEQIDNLIGQSLRESDETKLKATFQDIQKRLYTSMPGVPYSSNFADYVLAWPWVQNYRVNPAPATTRPRAPWLHEWLDESKRT